MSIENLTLGDPQVKNREIVLTAKFTATTYRQEEKVEPDAAKPAGDGRHRPRRDARHAPREAAAARRDARRARRRARTTRWTRTSKRSGSDAQRLKGGL